MFFNNFNQFNNLNNKFDVAPNRVELPGFGGEIRSQPTAATEPKRAITPAAADRTSRLAVLLLRFSLPVTRRKTPIDHGEPHRLSHPPRSPTIVTRPGPARSPGNRSLGVRTPPQSTRCPSQQLRIPQLRPGPSPGLPAHIPTRPGKREYTGPEHPQPGPALVSVCRLLT